MDVIRRIRAQLLTLARELSPNQRWIVAVLPLLVFAGIIMLVVLTRQSSHEFLLGGKYFSPDEIIRIENAFQAEGLTSFKLDGQRIAVPRLEVDRYTAIAAARNTLPAEFSADFDRMQSKVNLFTSSEQRKEMLEEARKIRLAKILRAIPDIEDAVIEWERLRPTGLFRPKSTLAAQVSVRPRSGMDLSSDLVQSLKLFVAGALAGANSDDITVVDMNSGKVYGPKTSQDAEYDRVLSLTRQRNQEYEALISQALMYIPKVLVSVNVDLDNTAVTVQHEHTIEPKPFQLETTSQNRTVTSSQRPSRAEPGAVSNAPRALNSRGGLESTEQVEESQEQARNAASYKNVERRLAGLMPKSVQVAISIPEDYIEAVAIKRGMQPGTTDDEKSKFTAALVTIKQEVVKDVQDKVTRLIPVGAPPEAITVTSYTTVKSSAPVATINWTESATQWSTQWGGIVGLGLFALWAIWMVNRSAARLPELLPPPVQEIDMSSQMPEIEQPEEKKGKGSLTKRDELQEMVRDNPELAAAVLSRWVMPNR